MDSRIQLWLDHPVTQCYMRLLKEHKDAHIKRMFNCGVITPDTLPELAQIKGQVNALDLMLDLDELENLFEGEINTDEDLQTITRQNYS